jgi:predicted nucleotidyltransferase
VFIWPPREQVERALGEWWTLEKSNHPETWRLGYFGSYARGDWGVGSDLDLVALVLDSPCRFDQRSLSWDLTALPLPADLVVYTLEEWRELKAEGSRLASQIEREAVWIYSRPPVD